MEHHGWSVEGLVETAASTIRLEAGQGDPPLDEYR